MKHVLCLLALGTAAPVLAASQDAPSELLAPGETAMQAAPTMGQTPVLNPDADLACEGDLRLVEGAPDEAEVERQTARPGELQPMMAVDYAIGGCTLHLLSDGSLRRPSEPSDLAELLPAQ